jgi:hypothetical protein
LLGEKTEMRVKVQIPPHLAAFKPQPGLACVACGAGASFFSKSHKLP